MLTVKGTYDGKVIRPSKTHVLPDTGCEVLITFLSSEEPAGDLADFAGAWAGPPLERPAQGNIESRDAVEW